MNKQIKPTVYRILREDKYAREDNWYLIEQVAIEMLPCEAGTAFRKVIQGLRYKGISAEGITRAKRKFFEEYPQYLEQNVEKARRKEEEEYFLEYGKHVPYVDYNL